MVIKERYNQFLKMLENSSTIKYTSFQKNMLFLDFLWTKLMKGTYLVDYIQYEFYNRNNISRDSFIDYHKLHKLIDLVNDKSKEEIFNSKISFNKTFKDYLNRDWLDMDNSSEKDFIEFSNKHNKIIVKPKDGSFGIGIEIIDTKKSDLKDLYNKLKGSNFFVESVVKQHHLLDEFNDSTLNTLRMVTMIDSDGKPHVMDAILRLGRKGKHTDNFHNEGLACLVNVKDGIVYTIARDKKFQRYTTHPDSHKAICGFKVPEWEKVINKCEELALVVPEVRYVGWDIAINEDGDIVCIEGNYSADPDASQAIDQIGKYQKYFSLI